MPCGHIAHDRMMDETKYALSARVCSTRVRPRLCGTKRGLGNAMHLCRHIVVEHSILRLAVNKGPDNQSECHSGYFILDDRARGALRAASKRI